MSNANRFITAYNQIDKALRAVYNFKNSMTFTDVVRKASAVNPLVEHYSDEILSYARLRNAIVHNTEHEKIIAEPHDDVTEEFERIAALICRPPKAEKFAHKPASAAYDTPIAKVMELMIKGDYSNVPVIKDFSIIGVITNKMIVAALQSQSDGDLNGFFKNTPVSQILLSDSMHYEIAPKTINANEAITRFVQNRKLALLILTSNGLPDGDITAVLTVSDLPALTEAVH